MNRPFLRCPNRKPCTLDPTHYTLHTKHFILQTTHHTTLYPATTYFTKPYTLHLTHYTLRYTLHTTHYIHHTTPHYALLLPISLHPTSTPYNPHPTRYTLHTSHNTRHTSQYTLNTAHYTLHITPLYPKFQTGSLNKSLVRPPPSAEPSNCNPLSGHHRALGIVLL